MRTSLVILGALLSIACGPWFPTELLTQRDSTLLELDEGDFFDELEHLVQSPGPFANPENAHARDFGGREERILYDTGAMLFRASQYERAEAMFEALLALPPAQRFYRSTWAAYMLGRIRGRAEDYQLVRALAIQGFRDGLALASSSLGQEAYLRLRDGDSIGALRLYAQQAALGDEVGLNSLLEVMRDEALHPEDIADDPLGRRLLGAFLYARANELDEPQQDRIWRALAGSESPVAAAQLAGAAYRDGRWALAGTLASRDPDAMVARWVRAKLALRAGDTAEADRLLALAQDDAAWSTAEVCGERATLALATDDPITAMGHAWEARDTYPYDAAYIAERVLFTGELESFIHARRDATPELRELLARRLMREDAVDEAVPYFTPSLAVLARMYWIWRRVSFSSDDAIARAGANYRMARLLRIHGLELFGTELGPDWGIEDAQYDVDDGYRPADSSSRFPATALEQGRVAASAPASDRRYHYRYLASARAEKAADYLPERSQAFAASLCYAAHAIQFDDQARVDALYQRYLDDGAMVSMDFPGVCPAPEFDRARRFLGPTPRPVRWQPIVGTGLGLLALALALLVRRNSRRWFTTTP